MSRGSEARRASGVLEKLGQIKKWADECIRELAVSSNAPRRTKKHRPRPIQPRTLELNFDAHERAFVKANVRNLTGS